MAQADVSSGDALRSDVLANGAGAIAPPTSLRRDRFVTLDRTNGSKVACQVGNIGFLAEGDDGSVLHFAGSSQVNVSQSFAEVLALLNSQP